MNLSGQAVVDLLRFFKIDPRDLLVVVDEVAAGARPPAGAAVGIGGRAQRPEVGHRRAGNRGFCAAEDRCRARRCPARSRGSRAGEFDPEERSDIAEAVGRAADAAELFVTEGIGAVMNTIQPEGRRGLDNLSFSLLPG